MAIKIRRRKFKSVVGGTSLAWPLAVLLTGFVTAAVAEQTSPASVKAIALEWFEHLQAGQIDRTQMTTALSETLTDDSVKEMSHYLKSYGPTTGAEIVQDRKIEDQTFYVVKLLLKRGDALSLLIGFDESGKITGVTFPSMGQE
jgi:hypothetical protein